MTTSYGVKPKQDVFNKAVYGFTVYYNNFASDYDVRRDAELQIKSFMKTHNYSRFKILRVDRGPTTKAVYEVRFYRGKQASREKDP